MIKALFLFFIFITAKMAVSMPTPEGLLRNGHNKDNSGNLIILEFTVNEVQSNRPEKIKERRFFKLFIEINKNKAISILQTTYLNSTMNNQDAIRVYYPKNFREEINQDQSIEKKLFYSLLMMLGANDSFFISRLLKEIAPQYKTNAELLNQKKLTLYNQYKKYLKHKKEMLAADKETDLISPLEPVGKRQKARVRSILAERTYAQSPHISLVKKEKKFFWELQLDNITFLFTNKEHQFYHLLFNDPIGTISIQSSHYFRPDGIHNLPKYLLFSPINGKHYKIFFLSLKHIMTRKKMIKRREDFPLFTVKENPSIFPFLF